MLDLTYAQAIEKRDHLIALGETKVWLRDDKDFPFDRVTQVESGGTYRLNGPASARLLAEVDGLQFSLNVEFEGRDANGRGVSLFDRDRLRDVMVRLPTEARTRFADMLEKQVMPPMIDRTAEYRKALGQQLDSEECVRGLIAFAKESPAATA